MATTGSAGSTGVELAPDAAEQRVAWLRDDVARLVGELERRYHHAVELPRRLEERGRVAGLELRRMLQRNKWPLLATAGLGATGLLVLLGLRARRRRRLSARLGRLLETVSAGRAWVAARSARCEAR